MNEDSDVTQPIGEGSCLIAAALSSVQAMTGRRVRSNVSTIYTAALAAGLYQPSFNADKQTCDILNFAGREVKVDTRKHAVLATATASGAYPLEVAAMVQALRDGLTGFIFVYPVENLGLHAVCALRVEDDQLIIADQMGIEGTSTWAFPLDWALSKGVKSYGWGALVVIGDPEPAPVETPMPEPEYLPDGVIADHFGAWRAERKAKRQDYTDLDAFLEHLAEIGANPYAPHESGYPAHRPLVETPPPPPPISGWFIDLRCLQVWQNYDVEHVANLALAANMNAVMVKALDGAWWMGQGYRGNPASAADVETQREYFHSRGLRFGVWVNPLWSDDLDAQAAEIASAARIADFIALDTEPYTGFWGGGHPAGDAARLCAAIRAKAPDANIIWQPDPRGHQLIRLRPEEWSPIMDAWGGQHYFDLFGSDPRGEVENAVIARDTYLPGKSLIPTFSIEEATPKELREACAHAREVGASGFILWRYGIGDDLGAARAAVDGWVG